MDPGRGESRRSARVVKFGGKGGGEPQEDVSARAVSGCRPRLAPVPRTRSWVSPGEQRDREPVRFRLDGNGLDSGCKSGLTCAFRRVCGVAANQNPAACPSLRDSLAP